MIELKSHDQVSYSKIKWHYGKSWAYKHQFLAVVEQISNCLSLMALEEIGCHWGVEDSHSCRQSYKKWEGAVLCFVIQ